MRLVAYRYPPHPESGIRIGYTVELHSRHPHRPPRVVFCAWFCGVRALADCGFARAPPSLEMFNVNFGSYCNVNLLLTPDLNIVQVLTIVIVVIVVNIVCRQLRTAKAEKIERNETIPTSATSDLTAASVKGHRWLSSHSGTHTSNINTIIQNSFL